MCVAFNQALAHAQEKACKKRDAQAASPCEQVSPMGCCCPWSGPIDTLLECGDAELAGEAARLLLWARMALGVEAVPA